MPVFTRGLLPCSGTPAVLSLAASQRAGREKVTELRNSRLRRSPSQKIRADHLQHVPARFVTSQHQRGGFKGLPDHSSWLLYTLKRISSQGSDSLPVRCCPTSRSPPLAHVLGLVYPGCTIEALPVPLSDFGHLRRLTPACLPALLLSNPDCPADKGCIGQAIQRDHPGAGVESESRACADPYSEQGKRRCEAAFQSAGSSSSSHILLSGNATRTTKPLGP